MQSMLGSLKSLSRANVYNKTSLAGSSKAYKNAAAQKASSYRTYAQRKALMSMDSNRSVRLYSTPSVHPTDATTTAPVPILESLTKTYDPAKITQNTMLVKLDDLVALPDTFAVVHIGGHQYKVTKGDEVMIDSIDAPIQTPLIFDKVLLLGSKEYTVIGQPVLPSVKVVATVEEHDMTEKVIIYKKKRRKTYARKTGHRQPYTLLRIQEIMGVKEVPAM